MEITHEQRIEWELELKINKLIVEDQGWIGCDDITGIEPITKGRMIIPLYTRDLNVMYDILGTLTNDQRVLFADNLNRYHDEADIEYPEQGTREYKRQLMNEVFLLVHSTAKQLAIAFLRTKNKWKE